MSLVASTDPETKLKPQFLRLMLGSVLAILALSVAGCSAKPAAGYIPKYEEAINGIATGQDVSPAARDARRLFSNMEQLFSDLKQPDLERKIRSTYAEDLYFNDTFHTYSNREDVVRYLLDTAERVNQTTTQFEEIALSGSSYFVRWTMQMEFDVNGETIKSNSIGVSQIKFNEQGQVVFHQDFWDNTEGFFRHLPVVGYVIGKVKSRL